MTDQKPADALAQHWTDRLPAAWKPYARLARLDRPIGWQLLLMPCWMGLALSRAQTGFRLEDAFFAVLFALGAVVMRGAGCVYNDILDRDIDAQVARTALRPIASGQVKLGQAWLWLLAQCLIGFVVLLALPRAAQITALVSLPLIALYPLMKRITWWPQAWLGIVFSWGALVGAAAATGGLTWPGAMLYLGCILWTIAYDTIYALQDREDDALVGVRSTARLFGKRWRLWTLLFYVGAILFWSVAWGLAMGDLSVWTCSLLVVLCAFFVAPMLYGVDDVKPDSALAAFKSNAMFGLLLVVLFSLRPIWLNVTGLAS